MNCDVNLGCVDIVMDYVNIVSVKLGYKVFVFCKNVYGKYFDFVISCQKKYQGEVILLFFYFVIYYFEFERIKKRNQENWLIIV